MQAEAGASIATCGEERIERFPPDIETHAAAIVAKNNFDMVTPGRPHVDINGTFLAVGKSVRNRVEEEVGQDLAIGARIAVDHQALRHVDGQLDRRPLQDRPQARDDLVGGFAEAELPALGARAVDRDLLEGLNEFAGAVQIAHQLLGGIARGPDEFVELRAP